ncbi:hypothetical protein SAMN06265795_11225 [Noviherbaspirillum humi]|uniref:Uncharacterized protein n=1 Tax=Noviherbaspirillum humi TaxID=1688639 RepID=A0A239JA75_9BURK|nr:hypothetical protein SAMN06265795_11225 [Noviherbaspirillum humi]
MLWSDCKRIIAQLALPVSCRHINLPTKSPKPADCFENGRRLSRCHAFQHPMPRPARLRRGKVHLVKNRVRRPDGRPMRKFFIGVVRAAGHSGPPRRREAAGPVRARGDRRQHRRLQPCRHWHRLHRRPKPESRCRLAASQERHQNRPARLAAGRQTPDGSSHPRRRRDAQAPIRCSKAICGTAGNMAHHLHG